VPTTATDFPLEVATAVALDVLFLEGYISDIDEVFVGGFKDERTLSVHSKFQRKHKM